MKLIMKLLILLTIAVTFNIAKADYATPPPDYQPATYCNDTSCFVWEDAGDGILAWVPTTPSDPEPPTYCGVNGCHVYQCSTPGNCDWNPDSTYNSASVCTLTGCYVFQCSSTGCEWTFKARKPTERVFYSID